MDLRPFRAPRARTVSALLALALVPCCGSTPDAYDSGLRRWREQTAPAEARPSPSRSAPAPDADDPALADVHDEAVLDALLAHAEREHPALRAAAEAWRAALEQVRAAVAFPDPRLTLGWFDEPIETRVGPMDWRVALVQALPRPDESDLQGRAALARAEAAAATFDGARLQLRRRAREAWIERAHAARALELTHAHTLLVQAWERVAATRYATGAGRETDAIRAQVELGKLDDRGRSLADRLGALDARLDAALGRAPGARALRPVLSSELPEPADETTLLDGLDARSPRLLAHAAAIEAAASGVALVDAQRWPDVAVGVEYTNLDRARMAGVPDSGQDALALTLSLGLPLRRERRAADTLRADAELSAARARLEDARLQLRADVEQALFAEREAFRRIALYRDTLVPKGRQAVDGTLVAYQSGEASFLDLLDAERALLEFELTGARALADLGLARAALEELAGVPASAAPTGLGDDR